MRFSTEDIELYYCSKEEQDLKQYLKLKSGFNLENCLLNKIVNPKDTIVSVKISNDTVPEGISLGKIFLGYEDKYYLLSKNAIADLERIAGFKFAAGEFELNECVAVIKNITRYKYIYAKTNKIADNFLEVIAIGKTRKISL